MNARVAPRAATWLLERLGNGPRIEPLIGDLVEQFESGRSRIWFWRQATGALGRNFLEVLQTHAPSFIVAVIAGCLLSSLWQFGCSLAFQPIYVNLAAVKQHPWALEAFVRLAGMQVNMVTEYALCFASAWLVTRLHRAHQRAVLVAFVAVVVVRSLPTIAQPFDNAPDSGLVVSLVTHVILTVLRVACTLVGGLLAIRTKRFARLDRWTYRVAIIWVVQMLATGLLFAARRVGELSYARPEGYLAMYAVGAVSGLYLAVLLWRESSSPASAGHPTTLEKTGA
ncbi:MAG TPA: hypothetical protein VHY19_09940 [Steroidobacteraceae bacterium]|jgi:hypothetical protein|nr:hypothetical protein [Steroidobacteraceae bacterium]